jgi:hypothetical protein
MRSPVSLSSALSGSLMATAYMNPKLYPRNRGPTPQPRLIPDDAVTLHAIHIDGEEK